MTKLFSLFLALVLSWTILLPPTAIAAPSLDQTQQVFMLSVLSNALSGIPGTKDELTQKFAKKVELALEDPTIQGYIGEWEVVWGPAIFLPPVPNMLLIPCTLPKMIINMLWQLLEPTDLRSIPGYFKTLMWELIIKLHGPMGIPPKIRSKDLWGN